MAKQNPNINFTTGNSIINVNGTIVKASNVNDPAKYASGQPVDPNSNDPLIKNLNYAIDGGPNGTGQVTYIDTVHGNATYNSLNEYAKSQAAIFGNYTANTTAAIQTAMQKNLTTATSTSLPIQPSAQNPNPGGGGIFSNPLDAIAGIATDLTIGGDIGVLQKFGLLKYPKDILESQQDTLVITQFRYNPPNADVFKSGAENVFQSGLTNNTAIGQTLVTVILPAPNNAMDSNNVGWGPDNMNNLTAAAAQNVLNRGGELLTAGGLSAVAGGSIATLFGGNPLEGAAKAGALGVKADIYSRLLSQAGNTTGGNAQTLIGTALASQVLNMAGFEVSPESILARSAGVIPNSNLELLFNSPTLREFRFDYRLSPRSSDEATIVKNIIRSFKQGMAPRKVNAGSSSGPGGYFLATPNVFKLEYKYDGNKDISGINRFKICALTGFSVNYTPDGQWAAYDEGQPVSYMMSMSFSELEPVYESDYYDTSYNPNGLSVPGINDVGY